MCFIGYKRYGRLGVASRQFVRVMHIIEYSALEDFFDYKKMELYCSWPTLCSKLVQQK